MDKKESTTMTKERVQLLESIGFKWANLTGQELWDQRYSELVAFKKQVKYYAISAITFLLSLSSFVLFAHGFALQNGHCIVPTKSTDHPELGRWVTTQRSKKKKNGLDKEKKRKLDRIGFIW